MPVNIERPPEGLYQGKRNWTKLSSAQDHRQRYAFAANIFLDRQIAPEIADLGCGRGDSTLFLDKELTRRGVRPISLLGIDIDVESINQAQRRVEAGDRFSFEVVDLGKADALPERADCFGGITFIEVLEHIRGQQQAENALLNARRVARRGAPIIVSSPNRNVSSGDRLNPYNRYHWQEFSLGEFRHTLESGGMKVLEVQGQHLVPRRLLPILSPLQAIARHASSQTLREVVGKVSSLAILAVDGDPTVRRFNPEEHEPKYFVAICQPNGSK